MKTYFLSLINQFKKFDRSYDVKAILCHKSWLIFNDSGEKEVYIFQEDGTLITSINGDVVNAKWEYIHENECLLISANNKSYMFHPAFVNPQIFALQKDGTDQYAFMIDEKQSADFKIKTLQELNGYFANLYNKQVEIENKKVQDEISRKKEEFIQEQIEIALANIEEELSNNSEYGQFIEQEKRRLNIITFTTISVYVLGLIYVAISKACPLLIYALVGGAIASFISLWFHSTYTTEKHELEVKLEAEIKERTKLRAEGIWNSTH